MAVRTVNADDAVAKAAPAVAPASAAKDS